MVVVEVETLKTKVVTLSPTRVVEVVVPVTVVTLASMVKVETVALESSLSDTP